MSEPPTIECKADGPYLVKNLDDLWGSRGDGLETQPVMALCRCGGSAKKPFCDGTHRNNGFSGAKLADRGADRLESYHAKGAQGAQGAKGAKGAKGITIHDNRSICAHAGRCTDGLAAVFKYKSEPWIDPEGGAVEQIIETVRRCPSGALSFTLDAGAETGAQAQRPPSIKVTKDGPYEVTGGARLLEQIWAQGASTEHYTLCRCGGSRNKPFCDGTHWSIGFKDESR